jgi:predicted metal-binding membrane protein
MLMALLFVGGVMNLVWIAALSLLVLAEKLLPAGAVVAKVSGGLMLVWAAATLLV